MKTASGHEFEVAWNEERLDVALAVDPAYPLSDHWIVLTPVEARDLADRLNNMARICESRGAAVGGDCTDTVPISQTASE